jgi:hypothetical protein
VVEIDEVRVVVGVTYALQSVEQRTRERKGE